MKTQTPRHPSLRAIATTLALLFAALLLSSCHHGVYGQRYPHPHKAIAHHHAPDHYGPARDKGQTWHRQIKKGKEWPHHNHTTWHHLYQGPRDYHFRTMW